MKITEWGYHTETYSTYGRGIWSLAISQYFSRLLIGFAEVKGAKVLMNYSMIFKYENFLDYMQQHIEYIATSMR